MITGQVSGGFGGITEQHAYNQSLEYTQTKASSTAGTAMDLTLAYSLTGGDNGSVTGITNNQDTGRNLALTYDPLNRIATAASSAATGADCWGQNFTPDVVANLNTVTNAKCSSPALSVTVDANNHVTGTSFSYDAVGNMTGDGQSGVVYTFDDEGRMIKATPSSGSYCYVYDGNGLRVARIQGGTGSNCSGGTYQKLYWRSISGDSLTETDGSGSVSVNYTEYVFFTGRRIASRVNVSSGASPNVSIFYYFADQLGSTRTITTGSGKNNDGSNQTPGLLCYDQDYTPYGQEVFTTAQMSRLQTTACPTSYKFTGYERDSETGLDYAFARYYSPRLARFLSTDPLGGDIGDLQSHNAYSYTSNNPLNFIDPSGMGNCKPHDPNPSCHGVACLNPMAGCVGTPGFCGISGYCDNNNPGDPNAASCSIDGVASSCSAALGLLQSGAGKPCADPNCSGLLLPGAYVLPGGGALIVGGGCVWTTVGSESSPGTCTIEYVSVLGGPSSASGWAGNFFGNVGHNLIYGVREPGQSFSNCVGENIKTTTFGKVDPDKLLDPVILKAEASAMLLAATNLGRTNGLQLSAYAYGGLAARLFGGIKALAPVVATVARGGGYGLAIAGAATVGLVTGSAVNCL